MASPTLLPVQQSQPGENMGMTGVCDEFTVHWVHGQGVAE